MNKTALVGAAIVLAAAVVVASLDIKNRDINSFSEGSTANPIDVAARSAIEPPQENLFAPPPPFDGRVEDREATINNQPPDDFATTDEERTKSPPEPRRVSGHVVDEAGIAIAGAIVALVEYDFLRAPMPFSATQQETFLSSMQRTTSNTIGFFSLPRVASETMLNLEVSAPGYFMPRKLSIGVGPGFKYADLTLSLEPGLNLYGELRDPAGKPLPGALIVSKGFETKSNFTGSYAMHRYGHSSTVSDGDGHFLLGYDLLGYDRPELLTGITTLEVRSGLFGATVFANVFVGADEVIVLQWPASGTLTGTIAGIEQYPSEKLTLALHGTYRIELSDEFGQPREHARGGGTKYEVPISKDGQYRIEGISTAQTYEARIRNDKGEVLTPTIPLAVFEGDKTQEFDYILTQPVTISGVVRGALSGRPLRDVQVRWRSLEYEDITDAVDIEDDGTYRLEFRAPAGTYVLYPTFLTHDEPQYREIYGSTISIEPGGEYAVHLTFLDPVTRTVVAIDEFGDPIADAGIAYREFPQSYSLKGRRTDETGRFTYHGVRPYQEASLVVSAPISEFKNAETEAFAAEPGQVFEEEVVILHPK